MNHFSRGTWEGGNHVWFEVLNENVEEMTPSRRRQPTCLCIIKSWALLWRWFNLARKRSQTTCMPVKTLKCVFLQFPFCLHFLIPFVQQHHCAWQITQSLEATTLETWHTAQHHCKLEQANQCGLGQNFFFRKLICEIGWKNKIMKCNDAT